MAADPPTHRAPLTTFVGRARELSRLKRLVKEYRLVTVMGPGGIGKTRLALQLVQGWDGPTVVVDARAAHDVADLVRTVARALPASLDGVASALAARGALLVLVDNFEHLVESASSQLHAWLLAAPELTLLVTSRRRLGIEGEVSLVVPAMATERREAAGDDLPDALALLLERARRHRPELALDAGVLAEIAERLEGVPLALELAAAQLRLMDPTQLLARLGDAAQLLDAGAARSVGSAVAGSWSTLDAVQRQALAACGTFRGGFVLDAGEYLLAGLDRPGLTLLGELLDRSLIYRTVGADGAPRLALFQSVAAYATQQLAGDAHSAAQLRHAEWAAAACARGLTHAAAALSAERDNLEQAMAWLSASSEGAVGPSDRARFAAQISLGLAAVFEHEGPASSAIEVLEAALSLVPRDAQPDALQLELRVALARAQLLFGDASAAAAVLEQAEQRAQAVGAEDSELRGRLLMVRAMVARLERRLDEAEAAYRQAADVFGDSGSPRHGRALSNLAGLVMERGRLDEARDLFDAALTALRAAGDARLEAVTTGNQGLLEQELNAFDAARASFHAALKLHEQLGNRRFVGITYGDLAGLHAEARELEAAAENYRLGIEAVRLAGDWRHEALLLAALSACEGRLGRAAAASEAANRSRELLRDVDDPPIVDAAGLYLGADAPVPPDDSDEVRLATRLMAQAAADKAFYGESLRVGDGAAELVLPDGTEVSLQTRPTLARVLEALVARRLAGGPNLSIGDLVRAAWPEQRAVTDAAKNRVHVALSTLRSLGLKGIIVREDGGYRLRADVPVVRLR